MSEKRVVGNPTIAFGRVRDVEAGTAQSFYDLPVYALIRVQLQAALGSSG